MSDTVEHVTPERYEQCCHAASLCAMINELVNEMAKSKLSGAQRRDIAERVNRAARTLRDYAIK